MVLYCSTSWMIYYKFSSRFRALFLAAVCLCLRRKQSVRLTVHEPQVTRSSIARCAPPTRRLCSRRRDRTQRRSR